MTDAFALDRTYIRLRPDESATSMAGGAEFWARIANRTDLEHGRLTMFITPGAGTAHRPV
ncbi:MAG: hypothetical protein U1E60_23175 [Reyranellaceae bacterium]